MKIAELFAEVGFDVDNKPLNDFQSLLGSTKVKMTAIAVGAGIAVAAINRFTDASIRAASALRAFTIETGLNNQALRDWQVVTRLTDIDATAQDVTSSIQALQSNLAQIRLGQGNIRPFQLLGINPYDDAFDVLEQLRGAIRGIDPAMAVNLLQEMGLGTEFIHTLQLSKKEFENLKRSYTLSDKEIGQLTALGTAFNDLTMQINHVKNEMVALFAPVLIAGTKQLSENIKLLSAPFKIIGSAIESVNKAMDSMDEKIKNRLTPAINGLKIVFNALKQAISPVITLFLILEDIAVFMRGGQSLTGDFVEGMGKVVDSLAKKWEEFAEKMKQAMMPFVDWITETLIEPIERIMGKFEKPFGKNINTVLGQDNNSLGTMAVEHTVRGNNINNMFDNIFNIQSINPVGTADAIRNTLQKQLNFGLSDTNNAGAY